MPIFRVHATYQLKAIYAVEADTLDDAIEWAESNPLKPCEPPIEVDDSFQVDTPQTLIENEG